MKFLVALVLALGGLAIALVSLAYEGVPKDLRGWGLFVGFLVLGGAASLTGDVVKVVAKTEGKKKADPFTTVPPSGRRVD